MWNLLVILALAAATTVDATATRLDGSIVTGQLESWRDGHLSLVSSAGPVEIGEADLLSLELSPATATPAGRPIVELIDGSIIPIAEFNVAEENAQLRLAPAAADPPQTLSIPLEQVQAVRLQSLDAAVEPQWQEIRDLQSPSDLLVVLKREGKSLDYLAGVVKEVTPAEVAFDLDGDTIRVARAKVAGLVYYRPDPPADATPRCVLVGANSLRAAAKSVRLDGEHVRFVVADDVEIDWPLADLRAADFSAGKVVFLSDLEPVSDKWQPLISLPAEAKFAARFGRPRIDRSATGGPLSLAFPDDDRPDGNGKVEQFAKGLALRSRTAYVVRLPGGYTRFLAVAGIDPSTRASGNVMLSIFGDDHLLMESPVAGDSAPIPIELDVAGVKRLRIVVDYGQNLDTGDWLNLCNARIVK